MIKNGGQITNREFAQSNQEFRDACQKVGIPPTTRQASKWRLGLGLAWEKRNGNNNQSAIDKGAKLALVS